MADLGDLVVRIRADTQDLEGGLRRVQSETQQSASRMGSALNTLKGQFSALLPAVTLGSVVAFGKTVIETAGHIQDLAERTGFAASTLAALRTDLENSGSSVDEFAQSMAILNNNLGEAAKGTNKEAIAAFDKLGLSVHQLLALNPEERFFAVADALGQINDKAIQTEAGRNLLGRGFASMIPILDQYNGKLSEAVKAHEKFITKEDIKRLDDFGDHMKSMWNAAVDRAGHYLALLLKINEALGGGDESMLQRQLRDKGQGSGGQFKVGVSYGEQFGPQMEQYGPNLPKKDKSAKGSNAGLYQDADAIKTATQAYKDYIDKLQEANTLIHVNENERAGVKAVIEAETLAQKAHIQMSDAEKDRLYELANATEEFRKETEEAARESRKMHDQLADGLADVIVNFHSAKDAAKGFFDEIAKQIIKKQFTGPLADGIMSFLGGGESARPSASFIGPMPSSGGFGSALSGISDFFGGFFADGGSLQPGQWGIAGENGPEPIFAGTSGLNIFPNSSMSGSGGQSVSVNHTWNIGSGVTRQELASMLPMIVSQTRASVFAAIESGGKAAQIVGKRT